MIGEATKVREDDMRIHIYDLTPAAKATLARPIIMGDAKLNDGSTGWKEAEGKSAMVLFYDERDKDAVKAKALIATLSRDTVRPEWSEGRPLLEVDMEDRSVGTTQIKVITVPTEQLRDYQERMRLSQGQDGRLSAPNATHAEDTVKAILERCADVNVEVPEPKDSVPSPKATHAEDADDRKKRGPRQPGG
jgi:hypothetical protein